MEMRDVLKRYMKDLPEQLEMSQKELSDLKRRSRFFAQCFREQCGDKCVHYQDIYDACVALERIAEAEELAAIEEALRIQQDRLRSNVGPTPDDQLEARLDRLGSGTPVDGDLQEEIPLITDPLREQQLESYKQRLYAYRKD